MKTKGIRISDGNENILEPTLSDILKEITNDSSLHWSILFLDGTPNPGEGSFLAKYIDQINNSENGISTSLEDLIKLSDKFHQMFETIVIGSKDSKLLKRYAKEEEMYIMCDIAIELIDCAFWEVYSKDESLILRLAKHFREIEFLKCYTQENS